MAKYRVTSVQFCAKKRTHCIEFNITVTAINTDDESDVVTFTEETSASTCSVLAQIYMCKYVADNPDKYYSMQPV